jgi:indolepyruvate ferredoxin oxidoreductase alpha subunit
LGRMVCVIGDSTFLHSGITPLMNMIYNKSNATVIILDNGVTAMTGAQEHPGTGYTAAGEEAFAIDYLALVKTLGVKPENARRVNPYNLEEFERAVREEINKDETSVIVVADAPCVLLRREIESYNAPLYVDEGACTGCRNCLDLGCPAISWNSSKAGDYKTADGKIKKRRGIAVINEKLCNGCGLCYQVCQFGAIKGQSKVIPLGFQLHKKDSAG